MQWITILQVENKRGKWKKKKSCDFSFEFWGESNKNSRKKGNFRVERRNFGFRPLS